MPNRNTGTVRLVVVFAVFATSFSAILIRLSAAPPSVIAAWRMAFAAAMTLPLLRDRSRLDLRTWGLTLAAGAFLAVHFVVWNSSLRLTSVAHATVLVSLHPLVVTMYELISPRHRVAPLKLVFVLVAVVGAFVLAGGGSSAGRSPTIRGDILAIAGAGAVSGYMILGARVRTTIGTAAYTVRVYAIAAVLLFGFSIVTGQALGPYPVREFVIFVALAVVCTILGHSLFNWAFRFLPTSDVSVSILLEPIFASIMAAAVFSEIPGVRTVLGAVIVFIALAMITILDRREN